MVDLDDLDDLPSIELVPRITSPSFREFIFDKYPILHEDPAYICMIQYLLFPDSVDPESGEIIICACDVLAVCKGQQKQCKQRNFKAWPFLLELQDKVLLDFDWFPYNSKTRKCRRVRSLGFSQDVLDRLDEELSSFDPEEKPVYFTSGLKRRNEDDRKDREKFRVQAVARIKEAENQETRRLLEYMNDLPPNSFTKVVNRHLQEAINVALEIPDENKRRKALQNLRAIRTVSQPFYQPSTKGNTVRIFPLNNSILTLNKKVRKVLTQDWTTYDLKSAQLAIVSTLWDVKEVQAFIQEDGSIWETLFNHMPFVQGTVLSEVKPILKKALYALVFGKKKDRFKRKGGKKAKVSEKGPKAKKRKAGQNSKYAEGVFVELGGDMDEWSESFFSHPLIDLLYKAREKELDRIIENQGAKDAFGRWLPIDTNESGSNRSIMAQVAQSYELKLLLPVLNLAESTNDFKILLWQHDGFSVKFSDRSKKPRWHNKNP